MPVQGIGAGDNRIVGSVVIEDVEWRCKSSLGVAPGLKRAEAESE